MNHSLLFFLISALVSYLSGHRQRGKEHTQNDFVDLHTNRTIDLQNQITKVESSILIKCLQVDSLSTYKLPLLKNASQSLVHISARLKSSSGEEEVSNIKINRLTSKSDDEFDYFEINFKSEPMNYEEERVLIITEHYFERLILLPKKISIKDDQLVKFVDSTNRISFYPSEKQLTTVILPHERTELIEYTKKNATKVKNKITYTIDRQISPLTYDPLNLHYEYNSAISVLNYATRTYEVSHWGNIAVEDRYQLENVGAILEGEFGRVDYDSYGRNGGKNAIRSIRAKLPMRSWGLWYRDEIGNVTTSRAAREWDDVRVDLTPRFPIMGGWKSNFFLGFNLPSKFHITNEENNLYNLNLTFGTPYSNILAKNYTVKVVLPEGAHDIKVNLPLKSKYSITHEKSFGYLDLFGSPTVIITMNNVYDLHKVDFQVQYKYSQLRILWKPFLVILFFFCLFLVLIIYFRMDLSLSKIKKE